MSKIDQLKLMLENWPLLKMDDKTKLKYLQPGLINSLVSSLHEGDYVYKIACVKEAEDLVKEALITSNEYLKAIDPDLSEEDLTALVSFLSNITVEQTKLSELHLPPTDDLSSLNPDGLFIQIISKNNLEIAQLQSWDSKVGFSRALRGSSISFNVSEMKLLYGVYTLMTLMSARRG